MVDTANYLFIDGNYLLTAYQQQMREYFGNDGDLDLRILQRDSHASKVFYYDAVSDDRTDRGKRSDFLARIQSYDGFHVQLGSVSGEGGKRRQKQVDVRLAVDMLMHAFRKNFWHATLVAGDLDFKPLVGSLVLLGSHVHVYYERRSASRGLCDAADSIREMTLREFWLWSSRSYQLGHRIPSFNPGGAAPNSAIVRRGKWNGRVVERSYPDRKHLFWIQPTDEDNPFTVQFDDADRLEQYFEMVYGPIEWEQLRAAGSAA